MFCTQVTSNQLELDSNASNFYNDVATQLNKILKCLFILLCVLSIFNIYTVEANTEDSSGVRVCNNSELKQAVQDAVPGDTIYMCDGEWNNLQLIINKSGTLSDPILITAENPGKVRITGTSYIIIDASFLHLSGFVWTDYGNPAPYRAYIQTQSYSDSVKIFDMVFEDDTLAGCCSQWIFNIALRGRNHEVSHIAFLGKSSKGAQMFVWEGGQELNHHLHHLYFTRAPLGFIDGQYINGGESLQLGAGDGKEPGASDIRVNHVFFENASGEPEVISLKGSRHHMSNIVMIGSDGHFSIRAGNEHRLENIYIDGQDLPGAIGIRFLGDNHTAKNIFVRGISAQWRGGLYFPNGGPNHRASKNVVVSNTTVIDADDAITLGSSGDISPENINFKNVISISKTSTDRSLFVNNGAGPYAFENSYLVGPINVSLPAGVRRTDPVLEPVEDGLYVSALGTAENRPGSLMTSLPVYKKQTGPLNFKYCY